VIIGIDRHKSTHTAVTVGTDEQPLARPQIAADRCQSARLLAWASPLGDDRTWAIESAGGLGKLLAQQLIGAGEHVIDVPPTLSARLRLGSTRGSKNDRNDALATAIAGLRYCGLRPVHLDDRTAGIRLRIDRYEDLVSLRTQAACRLHVALRELLAGDAPRRLSATRTAKLLRGVRPDGIAAVERNRLAGELLADVRGLDRDIATARAPVTDAVTASGTSLLGCTGSWNSIRGECASGAGLRGNGGDECRLRDHTLRGSRDPASSGAPPPVRGRPRRRGRDRNDRRRQTDLRTRDGRSGRGRWTGRVMC
jgi:transposase